MPHIPLLGHDYQTMGSGKTNYIYLKVANDISMNKRTLCIRGAYSNMQNRFGIICFSKEYLVLYVYSYLYSYVYLFIQLSRFHTKSISFGILGGG